MDCRGTGKNSGWWPQGPQWACDWLQLPVSASSSHNKKQVLGMLPAEYSGKVHSDFQNCIPLRTVLLQFQHLKMHLTIYRKILKSDFLFFKRHNQYQHTQDHQQIHPEQKALTERAEDKSAKQYRSHHQSGAVIQTRAGNLFLWKPSGSFFIKWCSSNAALSYINTYSRTSSIYFTILQNNPYRELITICSTSR